MNSKEFEINNIEVVAPCFSCQYCYRCKYWQNNIWSAWILENNECPALKYTFNSMLVSLEMSKSKGGQEELSQHSTFSKSN